VPAAPLAALAAAPIAASAPAPEQPVALQPEVREGDLVEVGGDVVPPEPVYSPKPVYPPLAGVKESTALLSLTCWSTRTAPRRQGAPALPDFGLGRGSAVRNWSTNRRPRAACGDRTPTRVFKPQGPEPRRIMSVLNDQQRKFYEDTRKVTRQEIADLENQIQESCSGHSASPIADGSKAARQMYGACQRLGPQRLEEQGTE
jgi:hypothetical protein